MKSKIGILTHKVISSENIDYDSENKILSANQIINKWNYDRNNICNTFNINSECCCECDFDYGLALNGSCSNCKILARLFPKGKIVVNNPLEIKVGDHEGKKFILTVFPQNKLHSYELQTKPINIGNKILSEYTNMKICETTLISFMDNIEYLGTKSKLENYIVISTIIEQEFNKINFPLNSIFKWAYSCKNNINIIKEISQIPIKKLYSVDKTKISYNILLQLVATLHKLNKHAFTHGEPNLKYLSFWNKAVNFEYEGRKIKSTFGLSIDPSYYSSISLDDNKRLYYLGTIVDQSVNYENLPDIIAKPFLTKNRPSTICSLSNSNCTNNYLKIRSVGYKINKKTFMSYVRYLGIPLFYSSFDLYSYFISLMCVNEFYNEVIAPGNNKLLKIWEQLWLPDEYEKVSQQLVIFRQKNKTEFEDILNFLSNFHLRCDALELTWESL